MKKIIEPETFSEVYEILVLLDNEDFKKIPQDVINLIREKRNEEYEVDIDNIICGKMKKDTQNLLASIYLKYLAPSEEVTVIDKLRKIEVDKKYNAKLEVMPKININDNIFEKKINTEIKQEINLVEVKKKNKFIKVIDFIKEFFMKRG